MKYHPRECQKNHWKLHKLGCVPPKDGSNGAPPADKARRNSETEAAPIEVDDQGKPVSCT